MARSIRFRWASSYHKANNTDGVRIRIEVTQTKDVDARIFAYRRRPIAQTGEAVADFSHVCSPSDLAEYPANAPHELDAPQWFRLSYVDVWVRSIHEAKNFLDVVTADVRSLKYTLDIGDKLFYQGTETVGPPCPEWEEPADSSSDSLSEPGSLSQKVLTAYGNHELSIGVGVPWHAIGFGAGSQGPPDLLSVHRSRVELLPGAYSQALLVQGFDLNSIPDDAVIEGVLVRVSMKEVVADPPDLLSSSLSEGPASHPRLSFISLQHQEYGLGVNLANYQVLPANEGWAVFTFGGPDHLWGLLNLNSGRAIKDGGFGVTIVVTAENEDNAVVAEVDGVEIEVFYTEEFHG